MSTTTVSKTPVPPSAVPTSVLHLVRHGESVWNREGRVQGQSPQAGSLTEIGRAQALRTARILAREKTRAEAIVTSDLARASETASLLASVLGLPVEEDPSLREQRLGTLEEKRFSAPVDDGTAQDAIDGLWRSPTVCPRGGESIADLYVRIRRALARHAGSGRDLILVTHGGPVRMAITSVDPRLGMPVPRQPVPNASAVTLTYRTRR